ncbi:MAG: hypothetical protein K6G30_15865 [Acetatifactor sp.]|jgi:hypothetical protein|nr:hypothetical protein [Acetatifactor sp.]
MEERFYIDCEDDKIREIASKMTDVSIVKVEQICERYGEADEDVRHYDAYVIVLPDKTCILKKTNERERFNYEHFLSNNTFAVPDFYGSIKDGDNIWILVENVTGCDLRDMTDEITLKAAESLYNIQNHFWGSSEQDGRFEIYLDRINRRADYVKNHKPELYDTYHLFVERQSTCPRTLSNGDLLQFNAIWTGEAVKIIDWGFGGIMPYSLDIARFLAHATENRATFPFYMTDTQKLLFLDTMYENLTQKPAREQFLRDINLALLNECVEFVEADEDEDGWYYEHALALAKKI